MSMFVGNILTNMINSFVQYEGVDKLLQKGFVPPFNINRFSHIVDCVETYQIDYFLRNMARRGELENGEYFHTITHFLYNDTDHIFKHCLKSYRSFLKSNREGEYTYKSALSEWTIIAAKYMNFDTVKFLVEEWFDYEKEINDPA